MGILEDQYRRPDYGDGYGYNSFTEALETIDKDSPDIGAVYKICGEYYTLEASEANGFYFERIES